MRKIICTFIFASSTIVFGQSMKVHTSSGLQNFPLSTIDSITFEMTPTAGLIAYFPFNGNANDHSGMNRIGTVNGATLTTDRFGTPNNAYSFDGLNDNITVDSCRMSNSFTICLWAYATENTGGSTRHIADFAFPWGRTNDSVSISVMQRFNEKWGVWGHFRTSSAADNFTGQIFGNTVVLNRWVFLVYTYDTVNNRSELFENGVSVGSSDATRPTHKYGQLYVGSHPNPTGYFKGKIDDIRMFNRVLTNDEIQALHTEGGWTGN